MGWIERLAYLPLSYILVITSILKIGLILCLCGTDYCSSGGEDQSTTKTKESEPYGATSGDHVVGIIVEDVWSSKKEEEWLVCEIVPTTVSLQMVYT